MNNKKKVSIILLFIIEFACVFAFDYGLRRVGFSRYMPLTIIVLCLAVLSFAIHSSEIMKKDDYLVSLVVDKKTPNRRYEYDWLRFFAASMVIVTHVIQADLELGTAPQTGNLNTVYVFIYMFCLACNPLYVMLSGALLFPYREESVGTFYFRRATKILIPMFVYYVFYLRGTHCLDEITFDSVKEHLTNFFIGKTPMCPHYWLMYVILGLYVIVPFLRYMFKELPYKTLTAMVVVAYLFMFLNNFIKYSFAVNSELASWLGVAVIGYWLTREESRKYYKWIMVLGVICTAYMFNVIRVGGDRGLCVNCSPIMVGVTSGIVALVFSLPILFSKGNIVLRVLSKYSFSIMLVHWSILSVIVRDVLGWNSVQNFYIGGILKTYLVTLVLSLGCSFFMDNVFVVVFNKLIKIIDETVKNKGKKQLTEQ